MLDTNSSFTLELDSSFTWELDSSFTISGKEIGHQSCLQKHRPRT